MSDVVNDQDTGALAAEFVLGTLDSDERARASGLLDSDPHFRGMVRVWERRLGELHLMVEPVEPPAAIWDRIKTKLESVKPDVEVSQPEVPEVADVSEVSVVSPAADTIATLEALEAELREEGLAPPEVPAPEPSVAVTEPPPLATREPQGEPAPERRDRVAVPRSPAPGRGARVFATLMTLVAIALAGLIAAWRYIPERLPPQLRAVQVLNIHIPEPAPAPVRPPAPPESRFDE